MLEAAQCAVSSLLRTLWYLWSCFRLLPDTLRPLALCFKPRTLHALKASVFKYDSFTQRTKKRCQRSYTSRNAPALYKSLIPQQ